MEVVFVISFLMIVCFMFGYFIGHNKGFNECSEAYEKYSITTTKGISGREYVEKYNECPMCDNCPDNCPFDFSKCD